MEDLSNYKAEKTGLDKPKGIKDSRFSFYRETRGSCGKSINGGSKCRNGAADICFFEFLLHDVPSAETLVNCFSSGKRTFERLNKSLFGEEDFNINSPIKLDTR